jgi:hypothetical protein
VTGARAVPALSGAWALTALATLGLRFWRLTWGLDDASWFIDEGPFAARAAAFVPLSWRSLEAPNFHYPTLYGYLAGAATAAAAALGLIAPPAPPYTPAVVLTARVTATLAGVATVLLVGLIGRRLCSARVGLVAAALLAVAPLHAMHSHIAATDTLLTACAALTILAAWRLAARGGVGAALAAGVTVGLATATKYTGLAFLLPVGWAVLEHGVRRRSVRAGVVLGATALAGAVLAFAIACPPCVLQSQALLGGIRYHRMTTTIGSTGFLNNHLTSTLGWYGRPYLYELVASLPYALGWPLCALSYAGVGVAAWRRQPADRLLLAALVPYFAAMGGSLVVFPRYLLPLFPPLLLLAARALEALPWRRVGILLLAGVWTYSLALSASQVARFSTRQQDEVVGTIRSALGGRPARVAVPQLMRRGFDYYRLGDRLRRSGLTYLAVVDGQWFDEAPEVLVLPEWREISIARDMPGTPVARDLARLRSGEAGYRLLRRWPAWYLQRDLYMRLDPAFGGDLWQGEIGFSVWVRDARRGAATGWPGA